MNNFIFCICMLALLVMTVMVSYALIEMAKPFPKK